MNKNTKNPLFDVGRMAPFSRESEYSIIGSIFHTRNTIHEAMSLVDYSDFFTSEGRNTFKAMVNLREKDSPIDVISVSEELKNLDLLEKMGGDSTVECD